MFIDLSHTIEHGMATYPGLPGPLICDYLSREASRERYATGVEFQIGKLEMVGNTGTYLDSPSHRYAAGQDLAALSPRGWPGLEAVMVPISPGAHGGTNGGLSKGRNARGRADRGSGGRDR